MGTRSVAHSRFQIGERDPSDAKQQRKEHKGNPSVDQLDKATAYASSRSKSSQAALLSINRVFEVRRLNYHVAAKPVKSEFDPFPAGAIKSGTSSLGSSAAHLCSRRPPFPEGFWNLLPNWVLTL